MIDRHRPWLVSITPKELEEGSDEEIVVRSPWTTPSFRRIVIPSIVAYSIDLVRLEVQVDDRIVFRNSETIPCAVMTENVLDELFDVPVEAGARIRLVFRSNSYKLRVCGVLLGTRAPN